MKNVKHKKTTKKILTTPPPLLPTENNEVVKSLSFLKNIILNHKWTLIFTINTFILGFLIALISPIEVKQTAFEGIFDKFAEFGNNGSKFGSEQNKLFIDIFFNNLKVTFVTLISGLTLISPFLIILSNGFIIGIFVDLIFRISNIGIIESFETIMLTAFLPHAIIEIPILFLSAFLSVLVGTKIIFGKKIEPQETRISFLIKILKSYILIIVPLIFIAAGIESFLSYRLAKNSLSDQGKKESVVKNNLLKNTILQPYEIKKLGLKAEETPENEKIDLDLIFIKTIGSYIYTENYETFQKPEDTIHKSYKLDNDSHLIISIQKFKSDLGAKKQTNFISNFFNTTMKNKNTFKATEIDNHSYKITGTNETSFFTFYNISKYAYYITYKGKDPEIFKKIVDLQVEKIKRRI